MRDAATTSIGGAADTGPTSSSRTGQHRIAAGAIGRPFFGGNAAGPGVLAAERAKLLNTPFGDYEQSLREDLSRTMAGTAFDFDRDVTAIYLYRWGHGMTMPVVNHIFGTGDRATSPRRVAAAPLGRIVFAGQETEGTPSVESAMASGQRAANEVLRHL